MAPRDTADLLAWALLVDNGTVLTRDGQILVGYYLSPPDLAHQTPAVRAGISARINAALTKLGTGWALWSDVAVVPKATYPADLGAFPDRVSSAVDAERRAFFTSPGVVYENERIITLAYSPPAETTQRLTAGLYQDTTTTAPRSTLHLALTELRRVLDQFEDQLSTVLGLRRMGSYLEPDIEGRQQHYDELVNYLAYCAHGRPVRPVIPDYGGFLDLIVGAEDLTPGHRPILGTESVAIVTIDGFPAQSVPSILYALSVLPMPYRFSQRFLFRDPHDAERDIKAVRWKWKLAEYPLIAKAVGVLSAPVNEDAVKMRLGCDTALSLVRSGKVAFGHYSAAVILRSTDRNALDEAARVAVRAIHEAGYQARFEGENATEALLGAIPGNVKANIRRPMLHTANLADLLPVSRPWTGPLHHPNPRYLPKPAPPLMLGLTTGNLPFRFTPSVGDLGNFVLFGPPGTGKTVLLNTIALQALRYPGMRIRAVDYKRGMLTTARAVGGSHHEIGGEHGPTLAPFAHLDSARELLAAQEWARTAFELQTNQKANQHHREAIYDALIQLRAQPGLRRVSNFIYAVQNDEIRSALRFYQAGVGAGGDLFDADASDLPSSHFDAFDVTNIMGAGDAILLPALLALFASFERVERHEAPMLVLLDEAWNALQHPLWAPRLRRDLKTKRSYNVSIGLATQNLSDVAESSLASVLVENVPTAVFGPNPRAQVSRRSDKEGPAELYEMFGLDWSKRETVRTAVSARQYAIRQGEDFQLVDFELGPLTLALTAQTDEVAVGQVAALIARHGEDWLRHHLINKGINPDVVR